MHPRLESLNGAVLQHADVLLQRRHATASRAAAPGPLIWVAWASWAAILLPRLWWTASRVRKAKREALAAWGRGELDHRAGHRSARIAAYRTATTRED